MSKETKNKALGLSDFYLLFYNFGSAVGWLAVLLITHKSLLAFKTSDDLLRSRDLYKNVGFWLKLFQSLAVLEVLHAALKLVRSNPLLTGLQVLSRVAVVWAIIHVFDASKQCAGVFIVCLAWSITEVVRYSYYAFNILGFVPYFLTWCRYSLFIVLYPLGVFGELTCIYYAITSVYNSKKLRDQYSYRLPNSLNFSFDILIVLFITVFAYIPGFPQLYMHMLAQRKKILSGAEAKPKQN